MFTCLQWCIYILVKGTIKVGDTATAGQAANNADKKVIFKNCALFTSCISRINNMQIDMLNILMQ